MASWYGPGFHGAATSIGEPYDMYAHDGRAQDAAASRAMPGHEPAQRPQRRRAHQRPRAVRRRSHHRPVLHRRRQARHAACRERHLVEVRVAHPPDGDTGSVLDPHAPSCRRRHLYVQAGAFSGSEHESGRRLLGYECPQPRGQFSLPFDREPLEWRCRARFRVRVGPVPDGREFDLPWRDSRARRRGRAPRCRLR